MKIETRSYTPVIHNGNELYSIKNLIQPGFKFTIVHCDGYIAKETVWKATWHDPEYYYTCESCACYTERNLQEKATAGH